MSKAEHRKYDTRQLEKERARRYTAGEPRLHHLSGPSEKYVLSAWHVRVGEEVRAPQVIATIETHSFILDFEAYDSGTVVEQCFSVGDIIPDGAVVARIRCSAETHNQ